MARPCATHLRLWLALAGSAAFWPLAWAGEPAADPTAAAEAPPTTPTGEILESTRAGVRSTAEWLARGVDSWFGDRPFDDGGNVTDGRLSVSFLKRQDTGMNTSVRFNAHFRLPNARKFAYLFVGRDDQRDVITDTPDAFSRQQRLLRDRPEDQAFVAGLGVRLRDAVDLRVGFRGGLKPYAQARFGRSWTYATGTVADFRETVFWALSERFGSTTALSLEHPLTSSMAVRWLSATTITQENPKFDWSSSLGTYRSYGDQRLLSLEALIRGIQGSGVAVADYGVQVKWEQPIYRGWLLAEVLGGHFWPKPDADTERGRAWAVGLTLKMRF